MIKKLRIKFVCINMLIVTCMLALYTFWLPVSVTFVRKLNASPSLPALSAYSSVEATLSVPHLISYFSI